jgi:type II secretory pathway component GspD/PulD (secretin)
MKRCALLIILLLPFLVLQTGCASFPAGKPAGDHFPSQADDAARQRPPSGEVLQPGSPIVRIIKGTQVENMEEALAMAADPADASPRGMQEKLRSLILREVRIRTIAELLTEICGYNVLTTSKVADRRINIYLKDLTLREAVESICRLNNIWYREGQGIITLMTREEYVRDIEIRQSDQTRAFFIRYTNAADMAKVIQAAMGSEVYLSVIEGEKIYGHIDPEEKADVGRGQARAPELSGGTAAAHAGPVFSEPGPEAVSGQADEKPLLGILTVFKRNNCIVARSLDAGLLNEMARIIEALDTPTSQVLLEIKILQLTLGDGFESFFEVNYADARSSKVIGDYAAAVGAGGSTIIGANTLDMVLSTDKLNARVRYFLSQGKAEVVSTPFLMAANNSRVEFFVGEETPLRDSVTTRTVPVGDLGETITTFEVEIRREELGTDVEMTTFINEDGTVTLEFDAEISTAILNYSTIQVVNEKSGQTIDFPLDGISKSELKSILTSKSGQSIAIGGIIRESIERNENKVPILGDIPYLGFFFKEINDQKKKTETVIILTPHVIAHPALGSRVSDDFLGRQSSHGHISKSKEKARPGEASPPDTDIGQGENDGNPVLDEGASP